MPEMSGLIFGGAGVKFFVKYDTCKTCGQVKRKPSTVEIYPHCIICGSKAEERVKDFIFLCRKHSEKWSNFWNPPSGDWRKHKKEWARQFLEFIKQECKK